MKPYIVLITYVLSHPLVYTQACIMVSFAKLRINLFINFPELSLYRSKLTLHSRWTELPFNHNSKVFTLLPLSCKWCTCLTYVTKPMVHMNTSTLFWVHTLNTFHLHLFANVLQHHVSMVQLQTWQLWLLQFTSNDSMIKLQGWLYGPQLMLHVFLKINPSPYYDISLTAAQNTIWLYT